MRNLLLVCCLHGDERYGLDICLNQSLFPFIIGNPLAFEKNTRFIDSDLNRVFPGNSFGNYEERRAFDLIKKIEKFDFLIDFHSSSNECPLFGIITKPSEEKIEFAKKIGLKKLVIMPESFASGKALIDFAKCGISLEVGPHNRIENVEEALTLIHNFQNGKDCLGLEIFEVFNIIKKSSDNILIKNFEEVTAGQKIACGSSEMQFAEFDFIPVLVGEKAYEDVLCLAARKYVSKYCNK